MKSTQVTFRAILTEHCDGSPYIGGMRAGTYARRIEVSIDALVPRRSPELKGLKKEIKKMCGKLKKSFPHRTIDVRVWPSIKEPPKPEAMKPFEAQKIFYITVRPCKVKVKA